MSNSFYCLKKRELINYVWKISFQKKDFIKIITISKIFINKLEPMSNCDKTLYYITNTTLNITKNNTLYYTNKINTIIMDDILCMFGF